MSQFLTLGKEGGAVLLLLLPPPPPPPSPPPGPDGGRLGGGMYSNCKSGKELLKQNCDVQQRCCLSAVIKASGSGAAADNPINSLPFVFPLNDARLALTSRQKNEGKKKEGGAGGGGEGGKGRGAKRKLRRADVKKHFEFQGKKSKKTEEEEEGGGGSEIKCDCW